MSGVRSRPLVSVAVPCRNEGRYLDEALRSIARQSAGDFEVVISDDASGDDSPAIAAAWCGRDPRFRLVRNPSRLGMTENWNRALAECRGRFVAKLDGDDAWEPRCLELLLAEVGATAGPVAALCRAVECDERLAPIGPWHGEAAFRRAGLDVAARRVENGNFFWRLSLGEFQLWHSDAFLLPRAELAALGGFDERWSCASDTAFYLRLLGLDRPVAHTGTIGVRYRRHPGSVSATFAAHGWKELEGLLVRLDALALDARRLARGSRAVRQVWFQTARDLGALAARRELWAEMPPELRAKLERAVAASPPPPLAVRLEGGLRLSVWRLLRPFRAPRIPGTTQ